MHPAGPRLRLLRQAVAAGRGCDERRWYATHCCCRTLVVLAHLLRLLCGCMLTALAALCPQLTSFLALLTPRPGLALELASPLLPGAFLLLACLGSICRAVTGVAGGATRMALTQASWLVFISPRCRAAGKSCSEGAGLPCVAPCRLACYHGSGLQHCPTRF